MDQRNVILMTRPIGWRRVPTLCMDGGGLWMRWQGCPPSLPWAAGEERLSRRGFQRAFRATRLHADSLA